MNVNRPVFTLEHDAATKRRASARQTSSDALAILAIAALAGVSSVNGIGFYSDDWDVLREATFAGSTSIADIFRALFMPDVRMRPVMMLFDASLLSALGRSALPLHLAMLLMAAVMDALVYFTVKQLGLGRRYALATAAAFATVPYYSTDRLWFSTNQALLSVGFYLASTLLGLRAASAVRSSRAVGLALASSAAALASVLAYELTLPLICCNVALIALIVKRGPAAAWRRLVVTAPNLIAVLIAGTYTASTTVRTLSQITPLLLREFAAKLRSEFIVGFEDYVFDLPRVTLVALAGDPGVLAIVLAILTGALTFVILSRAASPARPRTALLITLAGLGVFVLGFAVFVTARDSFQASGTGIENRTSIVAALGLALTVVGLVDIFAGLLPRARHSAFAALVAIIVSAWCIDENAIAQDWSRAAVAQSSIIAHYMQDNPVVELHRTIFLSNFCRYLGPGIVLETNWDATGVFAVAQNDPHASFDVLAPTSRADTTTLQTTIYGHWTRYPFRDGLEEYDVATRRRLPIGNQRDALNAIGKAAQFERDHCGIGRAGIGVPLWPLDQALLWR